MLRRRNFSGLLRRTDDGIAYTEILTVLGEMSSNSNDRILLHAERLRSLREKRGLSQHALGKRLGLGVNQINRYEKGINDPTATILAAIAQELGVTTDYLLGLSDIPQGYATADLNSEQRRLLDAYFAGDTTTAIKLLVDRVRELEAENGDSILP